jgi:hypothetical protein
VCVDKVHSLPLKAQERYRCSHFSKSAGEVQKPCKVCAGYLNPWKSLAKERVEGLLLQKVHRIEGSNT